MSPQELLLCRFLSAQGPCLSSALCKCEAKKLIGPCADLGELVGDTANPVPGQKTPELQLLTVPVQSLCLQKLIWPLPVWVWKAKWATGQDLTLWDEGFL